MKLLVTDFDGTLKGPDYEKNMKKIAEFVDQGNLFVVASGRNITSLRDALHDSIHYHYLICCDGSIMIDYLGAVVYRKNIEPDLARPVFQKLDDDRNFKEVYLVDNDHYMVYTDTPACAIIAKPKNREKAKETLRETLQEFPTLNGYLTEEWLTIHDRETTKETAVSFLQELFQLSKEDIIVVGDGINDLELIEAYDGYALHSSSDSLKPHCHKFVESVADLVDQIIKK